MSFIKLLPPEFQSDAGITQAVGSSLDSVSSGIQSAARAAQPEQISDWLDAFTASFPPIGSQPPNATGFAEAGGLSSPDVYMGNAREAGELKGFSNLVPMDEVASKLSDPSFDYQTALQGFADVLKDAEVGTKAAEVRPFSYGLGGWLPVTGDWDGDQASAETLNQPEAPLSQGGTESLGHEKWIELDYTNLNATNSSEPSIASQNAVGETEAGGHQKWIDLDFVNLGTTNPAKENSIESQAPPGETEAEGHEKWIELISVSHLQSNTLSGTDSQAVFTLESAPDSEVVERLQYLNAGIQELLNLKEGK